MKIYLIRADYNNKVICEVSEVLEETNKIYILKTPLYYHSRFLKSDKKVSISFEEAKKKFMEYTQRQIDIHKAHLERERSNLQQVFLLEEPE